MIAKARMSLAEFLALPEEKPYREYIDGEAVPKEMPNEDHAGISGFLSFLWYSLGLRAGVRLRVGPELRINFPAERRSFLPDVFIRVLDPVTGNPDAGNGYPEMVVELISPGDRPIRVADKVQVYLRAGITVWAIDPPARTVAVFEPGKPEVEFGPGEDVPTGPVVPGASIAVDEIFSVLD